MPSLPPIPPRLRELLKDYPDHLERLQESLNDYIRAPFRVMPFDGAIWSLEGTLGSFISEAREELKIAEASGNAEAIEKAKAKDVLMFRAHSVNGGMSDLHDLRAYFQQYTGM
ncbi:hypothetical protein ASD86_14085 [Lysobacter sp. Root690]|nr:hypothetical protein ASD86_14085 [Lysobacter sp. Root690]